MNYKYWGRTLEECLEKAEKELNIERNQFTYEIISEEKGWFRKKCAINVIYSKEEEDMEQEEEVKTEKTITNNDVLIQEDKIVIQNIDEELELTLDFEEGIEIYVNDEKVSNQTKCTAKDDIRFIITKENAKRALNLTIDKRSMECRANVYYTPEKILDIEGERLGTRIKIKKKFKNGEMPPAYSKEEVRQALEERGIKFGIIEAAINKASNAVDIEDLLVAKGVEAVNDENDTLKINFEKTNRNVQADSNEKVDYRNMYSLAHVNEGDILAEVVLGKEGIDGKNIFDVDIKRKLKKEIVLRASSGCKVEGNKVIATAEGCPSVKGGVFYVNEILNISTDVDIKSGNVDFSGDVIISKSVKEGMEVKAGNSILIQKNVETATIKAQGEVTIQGSSINSNITVGADDLNLQDHIEVLTSLNKDLNGIIMAAKELRKRLGGNLSKSDGKVVKLLIESKFKKVPQKALKIIGDNTVEGDEINNIKKGLKEKIIGYGPLGIKYSDELFELIKCIDNEIEIEMSKTTQPIDIYLGYCQDVKAQSTGNIFVTGKGEYVSNLNAKGNIEFFADGAVARGGILEAGNNIKAKIIGSIAGVSTILKVPKNGIITADIAYQNSVFIFGERRYLLESASKDVKAFVNKDGEIEVEKFVL